MIAARGPEVLRAYPSQLQSATEINCEEKVSCSTATAALCLTSLSSEDALEKVYEKEGRCMITDHRITAHASSDFRCQTVSLRFMVGSRWLHWVKM